MPARKHTQWLSKPTIEYVDSRIYSDWGIFHEEQEKIFKKCRRVLSHGYWTRFNKTEQYPITFIHQQQCHMSISARATVQRQLLMSICVIYSLRSHQSI